MMDKEEYKRELIRMWDTCRDKESGTKGELSCAGVTCDECPLERCGSVVYAYEAIEAVEKWSREHKKPKHKLSAFERDILSATIIFGIDNETFGYSEFFMNLLKAGYFDGAKPSDKIADYIKKCEVEE
ncbi:hypothetical protein [Sharpea azabuensis]|uniref:Uncharacterized protein n=1 Tax=Sharpea azabuensis TaxID=322505 RepID=A0A1H6V9D9_9FIRM|nr:hypothetical protein [Sharpea azabuensis]SEI96885.1 hypothetical protein SAMN04487834_104010 [Sharpea azabuensis]